MVEGKPLKIQFAQVHWPGTYGETKLLYYVFDHSGSYVPDKHQRLQSAVFPAGQQYFDLEIPTQVTTSETDHKVDVWLMSNGDTYLTGVNEVPFRFW